MIAKLLVRKSFTIGEVDPRIFGSFVEHLGRAVYGGIYEPGHETADSQGFRQDVIDLVKELDISIVRYPGGNFVSSYQWEDGVGPVEKRPKRLELAWNSLEPNRIGIQEFAYWAQKAGTEVMMAVNLGTRGIKEAGELMEYCNHPGGSYWSDLRISHGRKEPYNIKTWCLGNEMDGHWQVGQKTAFEYGRLANETAKALKLYNDDIELVVCGSSSNNMPTFPEWEREVLEQCYENVDLISLHKYMGNEKDDLPGFLASPVGMENFIDSVVATCDFVKMKKRSSKTINLSFDEWNVWYHSITPGEKAESNSPWSTGPSLLEDIYNLEDALVVGLMMNVLLRHADRVKMACLAQLVNVIAPIMTQNSGPSWRQTIFYPFYYASLYGKGVVLQSLQESPGYKSEKYDDVPFIDSTVVFNEEKQKLAFFIINRSLDEAIDLNAELIDFKGYSKTVQKTMTHSDSKAVNTAENPEMIVPIDTDFISFDGKSRLNGTIPPLSWNLVVLEKQ